MPQYKMKGMVDVFPRNFFTFQTTIKKSTTILEQLRKAAQEAFDGEQAQEYAESVKKASNTVQSAVSNMKRALAGFDEINRTNRIGSSAAKSKEQRLMEYLNSIDVEKTLAKLQLVRYNISLFGQQIDTLVDKTYYLQLALGMQEKAMEENAQAWQSVAMKMQAVVDTMQRFVDKTGLWTGYANQLNLGAAFIGNGVSVLQQKLQAAGEQMDTTGQKSAALAVKWTSMRTELELLGNSLSLMRGRLAGLFDSQVRTALTGGIHQADDLLQQSLSKMLVFLQSGFLTPWRQSWQQVAQAVSSPMQALPEGVKSALNQTITLFNGFLTRLTGAFNSWIESSNQLQLKLGMLTGTPVTRLMMMSTPKIPYLAQGAVLPANKPFMAVVGDQRHGTNVEAPLATIQEAMATVMQDFVSSNMAGHEATVAALENILQAVLGIHVGDEVIGAAMQRYSSKMAVVTGGVV